ncbi:MAG: fused MFS/spermidine synthase, partial [Planctomycetota bacterium]
WLLYHDTTPQGAQVVGSNRVFIPYQKYWRLTQVLCPDLKDAAFLGAGAFAMPEALLDAFPQAEVDVIEIDPEVIQIGRKLFRVAEYPRLNAVASDARRFLALTPKKYDYIFGDAYSGVRYIPSHLVTSEFFQLVKERLKPSGIYMMNIVSAVNGKDATLFKAVGSTLSLVFDNITVFVTESEKLNLVQNLIIVATMHELDIPSISGKSSYSDREMKRLLASFLPPNKYDMTGGIILKDDANPIEYIVATAIVSEEL